MPTFDLRGITVAKYNNTDGTISYATPMSVGDAMSCNLELRFAEGRLYAEGSLAEYLKIAVGGTISIGVKYIKTPAQILMYGAKAKTRTINEKQIISTKTSGLDVPNYVGTAFYAPDLIDSVPKYTCAFVYKTLFGPPGLTFQTKGDSLAFQTPTTTGEFLVTDTDEQDLMEVAVCDTIEDAKAWIKAVLA